jgi:hypothetical protein
MPREWSNNTRDPWNDKIHAIIKAIDQHTKLYLQSGEEFHNEQANFLRRYVVDLKSWIHKQEQINKKRDAKT